MFAPALTEFAADVSEGLTAARKTLPCRYLYDDTGSALFAAISVLPEYGLTRADARLVRAHAPEIASLLDGPIAVAELGSGDGLKTRWILEAMGSSVRYYAIDVSAAALQECRRALSPLAAVETIEDSFLPGLAAALERRRPGFRYLVLFLGSTIGNFDRSGAQSFLSEVRRLLAPGDALLLGADLVKDASLMLPAYDDPAGVTAAFNLNLLGRINRELQADFNLRAFAHQARWNPRERRVEMHLRSRRVQRVRIAEAGLTVDFRRGETIHTESSYKFETAGIRELAERAGFRVARQWIDPEWPFAETLLV